MSAPLQGDEGDCPSLKKHEMSENGSGAQSLKGKTIHWHLSSSISPLEEPLKVEGMPSRSHYSTKQLIFSPLCAHCSFNLLFAGGGGLVAKSCLTLETSWTVAHQAPLSMGSPGKNTGVSCHFLLQGIFPTQGLNPGLLHCRQILYR